MFENLLGQDEVISAIKADLGADRLPPAILFSGPPGSGKGTAALELARVLSCAVRGDSPGEPHFPAAWNCGCPACSRQRLLVHPDLLLLGPRSFPEEISAGLEMLERAPSPASAYFFVRAVRKLARRFDAPLYAGEETRLAKAAPLLREIEECLDAVAPEKASAGSLAPGASAAAAKSAAAAAKLEALVPDAPPVFMIRNVELWARLAPMGPRKVAIIENADRMLESARNALLKILEEPPESVRFVLTSSRRNAIMTTILSRARTYQFSPRDAAASALVVERVFRSSEPAPSVESFLAARRPFPPARARECAEAFLGAALSARKGPACPPIAALARASMAMGGAPRAIGDASEAQGGASEAIGDASQARRNPSEGGGPAARASALAELLEATKDFGQKDERLSSSFHAFLAALSSRLGDLLREEGMDAAGISLIEGIAALVRAASMDYETLNRCPGLVAEALMIAIGEAR